MRLGSALTAGVLALAFTTSGALASAPARHHQAAMRPSIAIKSVSVSGKCVTVKVAVSHFKLVPPVYKAPFPKLKGNQGHIHYILNGQFIPTRDAASKLSKTWCGSPVKSGANTIKVYLATAAHTQFPGTKPAYRTVMVH